MIDETYIEELTQKILNTPKPEIRDQILAGLAGVSQEHPLWKSVMLTLGAMLRIEHLTARQPSMPTEDLRHALGRETGLEDLRNTLLRLRAQAQEPAQTPRRQRKAPRVKEGLGKIEG